MSTVGSIDYELEANVLGACMLSEAALGMTTGVLRPYHFGASRHRTLYESIVTLDQEGVPVDQATVCDHLQRRGQLEEIGGLPFVYAVCDALPAIAYVERHIAMLRENATDRRIEQLGHQIAHVATRKLPPEERDTTIDKLIALIHDAHADDDAPTAGEAVATLLNDVEAAAQGIPFGLPTGYQKLDHMLSGLHPGQMVILAGRPGMGKSALATNIAQNLADLARSVLMFTLEMTRAEVAARLIARQAKLPLSKLRAEAGQLTKDDWLALKMAADHLSAAPLAVDDRPPYTMASIRARARRHARTKGLDLVVIDYLQLIAPDASTENRQVEVAAISRQIKLLARELHVPVLALSQLSRGVESRTERRPLLSDLRDSGALEQDADVVIFPWREGYYEPTAEIVGAELIVAKQRNGPVGNARVRWLPETVEFADMLATRTAMPDGAQPW